ncbi:MAG: type III-A CRISPR-associated RAMP protein Csm4 [Bryobacterales bacterium]|nr:type III-A CRISPR-associated RAMP protein Csm4 [Bryobacteraceae bacterium]MDW8355623.1 type III-A CRISPR-associated RAMP protein Csm4 [Bryobacterales bacterium]
MPDGFSVRFYPCGPWRIGPLSGSPDCAEVLLHSDAVYSAVTHAMNLLGLLRDWLDAVFENPRGPAVRFSSLFPFRRRTLFVPPPRSLWPPAPSPKVRWKGARFVPLSFAQSLIEQKPLEEDAWVVEGESQCVVPAEDPVGPFRLALRSFVAVDRLGAGVEPHRAACLEFRPDAGFWGGIRFASEEASQHWSGPVQAALRLLGDSGIGGNRSLGWGHASSVEFDADPFAGWPNPEAQFHEERTPRSECNWWFLSVFNPAPEDTVAWDRGRYDLLVRSGRVASAAAQGAVKRAARMVSEGSVLACEDPPRGRALNVAPPECPHPVYCAGYAYAQPLPVNP